MSKFQCTEEFMRKLRALLYYVYTKTYNIINCNCLCVLVLFHTRINFHASLSVGVSNSDHPVMYTRQFCTNNPTHKIYRCVSVRSSRHNMLPHNPTIINLKTFFAPAYHLRKIHLLISRHSTKHHTLLHNPMILHTNIFYRQDCQTCQKISSTSKYVSNTHSSQKHFLFISLGLGSVLRLWLQSNKPLSRNRYKSLHATTIVDSYFYFYVLHKYCHTHKDGAVLDNPYYSKVLHTTKYGVVLGTPIQYSQS